MQTVDAILILGHRLEADGSPSDDMIRRVDCAVRHWQETHAEILMPCGGLTPGQKRTEAEVMRDLLTERGVPQNIIHLEDRSRITIENIRNAKVLLGEGKRAALVTSDYHLARALSDCRRAGLNVYGVGAVTPEGPWREEMFETDRRIMAKMDRQRREGMTDQDITDDIISRMFPGEKAENG